MDIQLNGLTMQKTISNFSSVNDSLSPNSTGQFFLLKSRKSISSVQMPSLHPHSTRISSLPQLSPNISKTPFAETSSSFMKGSRSMKASKQGSSKNLASHLNKLGMPGLGKHKISSGSYLGKGRKR